MKIDQKMVDGILVMGFDAERLDTNIAPDLKAEFLNALNEQNNQMLLNLGTTKYADSSGLGALLLAARRANEMDGDFKICCANSRILHLIKIARLENHIKNYDSEEAALKSFSQLD